jgi:hypothetical protein
VALGVGLPVGRQARPRAHVLSVWEPTDVADLGDHDRGGDAAHAVEGLDCLLALVVRETAMELTFDHVQLILVALEQTAERRDPGRGAFEGHLRDPKDSSASSPGARGRGGRSARTAAADRPHLHLKASRGATQ